MISKQLKAFTPFVALLLVIVAYFHDFLPLWDGVFYSEEFQHEFTQSPTLESFRPAGHPSQAYFGYLYLIMKVMGGGYFSIIAGNTLLLIVSMFFFGRALTSLSPRDSLSFEPWVVTALLMFSPCVLGQLFNLNLDFPLVCYLSILLHGVLRQCTASILIGGVGLVFSKETGVGLYVCVATLYWWGGLKAHTRGILQGAQRIYSPAILAAPLLLFASYGAYLHFFAGTAAIYQHTGYDGIGTILMDAFRFDSRDGALRGFLTNLFILNFNWLLLLPFLFSCLLLAYRRFLGFSHTLLPLQHGKWSVLLLGGPALVAFALTRVLHHPHARYVVSFQPLLILSAWVVLQRCVPSARLRLAATLTTFALFFVSNFQTIDPLSRHIFGTFRFGKFDMLKVRSITESENYFGLDGLTYNLQYLYLHYALDEIFQTVRPDEATVLFGNPSVTWWLHAGRMDSLTAKRAFEGEDTKLIEFADPASPPKIEAANARFFAVYFPNTENNEFKKNVLAKFDITKTAELGLDGYTVVVDQLAPKSATN